MCPGRRGGGGGVSQEKPSLNAITRDPPLRAGIGPTLEYRYEINWDGDAGQMRRRSRLMTSQVWCPAWQWKAQI